MARPIKETPVLTGKDATRFLGNMKSVQKESNETIKSARELYEKIVKKNKFTF